jgi:hypothetical protein
VCEGKKTEVNYFRDLCRALELPRNLVVVAHDGSAPISVLTWAKSLYCQEDDKFDQVYCVFDKDAGESFDKAVSGIEDLKRAKKPKPFHAISSTPCFEYWLLLHFECTDKPFHSAGEKSSAYQVVADLQKHPGFDCYQKNYSVYKLVCDKTNTAIKNAEGLEKSSADFLKHGTNPSTHVHHLVKALQELKQSLG